MNKLLLILALASLAACTPRKTLQVPVSACTAQETGRTQEQTYTQYNCYSYDATGNCTMQVPSYYTVTYKEVAVSCNYVEWR